MKIDKLEQGELIYCNIKIEYKRKNSKINKIYNKLFNKFIFSRPYDCIDFPNLDINKYKMLINKLDRKNAYYINNVKIVNLEIITRTGYINETTKTRKT
tara:strand:- start:106 stop:402 length:297 start_codon:yes stop_codon:yes gene_type:complete